MIKARAIHLEKFILYDHQSYEFQDGITVIRGENRTGKSLIFSALGNLLYGAPPISGVRGKAKNMHTRAGSKVQFDFEVGGKLIKIVQALSGQSVKYSIIVDGQDLGTMTQTAALEIMEEYLPIPEDLFYSSVYIAGARRHPLHVGTGADKMRYLENMFDFQAFDNLRAKLQKMLQGARSAIAEGEALKAELASIPTGKLLSGDSLSHLSASVEYLKRKVAQQNETKRLEGERDALFKVPFTEHTVPELENMRAEAELSFKDARKRLREAEDAAVKAARYAEILTEIENFKKELSYYTLPEKFNLSRHEKELASVQNQIDDNAARIQEEKTRLETSQKALDRLKSLDLKISPSRFYSKDYRSSLEKKIKNHEDSNGLKKGDICPTCSQVVTTGNHSTVSEQEFNNANRQLDIIYSNTFDPDYKDREKQVARLRSSLKKLLERREKLESQLAQGTKYLSIEEKIADLEKKAGHLASFGAKKQDKSRIKAIHDSLARKLNNIEAALEARQRIDHINKKIHDGGYLDITPDSLSFLSEKVSELRSETSMYRRLDKRRREITERLSEIQKIMNREEILSALVEAYGPKGLRVSQMTDISRALEQSFNRFSPIIFPEPTFFTMGVAPSQVSVMVENNSLPPSDSSSLSGSEVRCFQILCYAALSPYIPSKYRMDSVILDEVEAMMTPETRNLFVQSAIPEIKKSVRSLTIVTPLPEDEMFIEADRSMQVIKERSKSSIKEVSR